MSQQQASMDALTLGRWVFRHEAQALTEASQRLDASFEKAVGLLTAVEGKLVVSGVGKSGHVGKKIAATFASTGTSAFFVHAGEAGHGDLGMIGPSDLLLVLSHSGETDEPVNLALFAKRRATPIIAMTGNLASSLAKTADLVLDCSIASEACPLGVAPTASTTVQLAMGDALAMATMAGRGFTKEDFGKTHPHGALGRRLFLTVEDVMQPLNKVPHLPLHTPLLQAVSEMASSRIGAVVVMNDQALAGIFTDADLRKLLSAKSQSLEDLACLALADVVSTHPRTISIQALASEALEIFETRHPSRLVCVQGDRPMGLLSPFDLIDHKVA